MQRSWSNCTSIQSNIWQTAFSCGRPAAWTQIASQTDAWTCSFIKQCQNSRLFMSLWFSVIGTAQMWMFCGSGGWSDYIGELGKCGVDDWCHGKRTRNVSSQLCWNCRATSNAAHSFGKSFLLTCLSHQTEDGSFSSCSLFSVVSTWLTWTTLLWL